MGAQCSALFHKALEMRRALDRGAGNRDRVFNPSPDVKLKANRARVTVIGAAIVHLGRWGK